MGQQSRSAERLYCGYELGAEPFHGTSLLIIVERAVEGFLCSMDGDLDHAFDAHEDGIFVGALLSVEEIGDGHHGSGAYVV